MRGMGRSTIVVSIGAFALAGCAAPRTSDVEDAERLESRGAAAIPAEGSGRYSASRCLSVSTPLHLGVLCFPLRPRLLLVYPHAVLLDLRYAWRGIRKARGFTTVILLTLALGIGANTTIFSIVHAMLIEPLPYRDADRLAFIWLGSLARADLRS